MLFRKFLEMPEFFEHLSKISPLWAGQVGSGRAELPQVIDVRIEMSSSYAVGLCWMLSVVCGMLCCMLYAIYCMLF